jgi:hypothetical protein
MYGNKRILARIQVTPDHIGDSFSKRKSLASFFLVLLKSRGEKVWWSLPTHTFAFHYPMRIVTLI